MPVWKLHKCTNSKRDTAFKLDKPQFESFYVATSWVHDNGQVLILMHEKCIQVLEKYLFISYYVPHAMLNAGDMEKTKQVEEEINKQTFYSTHPGKRQRQCSVHTNKL